MSGEDHWPGGVVIGVVAGLLMGHWSDFASAGTGVGYNEGVVVVLTVLVGAGSVLLSASTGRLWADAAASLPGRRASWWITVVINAVIFGFALWALQWLPIHLEAAAVFDLPLETLIIGMSGLLAQITYPALIPAVVTMFALVARRRVAPVPRWLVDGAHTGVADVARKLSLSWVVLAGTIPGLVAALALTVHRLAVGGPVDNPDRFARYLLWVGTGTLVALAVSFVALALVPRSGAAVGLVTGLLTAITAGLGIVMVNTFGFGNILHLEFLWATISTMAGQWFLGYLCLLPLTLVTWPASWRDVPGWLLTSLSVFAGGLTSLLVVGIATASRQV